MSQTRIYKTGGFLLSLVAVFGVALGILGAGLFDAEAPEYEQGQETTADDSSDEQTAADEIPAGLMVSQNGYTLALGEPQAPAGRDVPVSFTITGPDGEPVTHYDTEHEKQLHLIAVRRDFTGFQHVHPEFAPDGTWTVGLDLTPGEWRLFADFKATGAEALTLGADLAVAGRFTPAAPTPLSRTTTVDGYAIVLGGDLVAGRDAKLTMSIKKDGAPVTDLQPYLGAYGHLVALREGDQAYLHVHPDGTPDDGITKPGPEVVFYADVPSEGRYRLYLDFRHDGVVRTAAFTVKTIEKASGTGPTDNPESSEGHTGH